MAEGTTSDTGRFERFKKRFLPVVIIVILAVVVAIVFIIEIGIISQENQLDVLEENLTELKYEIERQYFTGISSAVDSLSDNQYVINQLNYSTSLNHQNTLIVLETTKETFNASLVYVMNTTGDVVASTFYGDNQTLVGNNYAFRPYFLNAMKGEPVVYPGVGVTTLQRGIYFSHPIYAGGSDEIQGVVVIKKGLEELDTLLNQTDSHVSLISAEGVVFSSNSYDLYKSVWPLSEEEINDIFESKQYAQLEIEQLNWKFEENAVQIGGKKYLYFEGNFQIPGWSIILNEEATTKLSLTSSQQLELSMFSLLTAILFAIILLFHNSLLKLRAAEHKLKVANSKLTDQSKELEQRVQQRTKNLKEKVDELERWKKVTVNRELRMIEIKEDLEKQQEKLQNQGDWKDSKNNSDEAGKSADEGMGI